MCASEDRRTALSSEKRARFARAYRSRELTHPSAPNIPLRDRSRPAPLSFGQERLWFLDQLSPGNPFYNDCTVVRFQGPLDTDVLRRSLQRLVERHEVLRTAFPAVAGLPVTQVMPVSTVEMPIVDLSKVAPADRGAEVDRRVQQDVLSPIRLVTGPPLRLSLLRLDSAEHVLLITIHHICSDAWSLGVLFREIETLYRAFSAGKEDPLPDQRLQYADFASWQRDRVQRVLGDQLPYWLDKLGGDPPPLTLPTDHPRPAVQSFRGASHAVDLSPSLSDALRSLSRRERVTPFVTLLTAFQILLHHRSGGDDIRVGSAVAGRSHTQLEDLIGFFVNTL